MKKGLLIPCALILSFFFGCKDFAEEAAEPNVIKSARSLPSFKGKLVYHHFTTYESYDSEMWLYDFETGALQNLSENWNVRHPMNAHFSPDGNRIVFMGIGATNSWDVFLYNFTTKSLENLTPGSSRDEDPKFSPDGRRIVFKQDGRLAEMNLATKRVTLLTNGTVAYSMPYYNEDGTRLICSESDGPLSSIVVMDISSRQVQTLYDEPGIQDYYPINADATSFYYSRGYSRSNGIDQVYRGFWNGQEAVRLPFNNDDGDYSDAYPVTDEWLVISSTRTGSKNSYDLYMANIISGEVISLSEWHPGINTTKNELGACMYFTGEAVPGTYKQIKNTVLTPVNDHYHASIYFTANEEFTMSNIDNGAYNRDFFEYNPATQKYKFTGASGKWDVYFIPEYNYIWVTRMGDVAPATYWVIGTGFSCTPRWYESFNSSGWDLDDVKQLAYMKPLGNNKYQATIYLSDQTQWGFDIKVFSNRTWEAAFAAFATSRITGDKQGMSVAGSGNGDIVMGSNFVPGYFRMTIDVSAGLAGTKVNFERIQ